jgi:Spy/CpxP family protein refolding chaperone
MRKPIAWMVAAVLTLALGSAAFAQAPSEGPRGPRGMGKLQRHLGLTDAQVTQLRQAYQGQREAQKQLWQSLGQAQRDLRQLALSGGDEAALRAKMAEVQQLQAQALELRVKTLQQIAPLLTPEQREKLAQMQLHGGPRGHHGDRGSRS